MVDLVVGPCGRDCEYIANIANIAKSFIFTSDVQRKWQNVRLPLTAFLVQPSQHCKRQHASLYIFTARLSSPSARPRLSSAVVPRFAIPAPDPSATDKFPISSSYYLICLLLLSIRGSDVQQDLRLDLSCPGLVPAKKFLACQVANYQLNQQASFRLREVVAQKYIKKLSRSIRSAIKATYTHT